MGWPDALPVPGTRGTGFPACPLAASPAEVREPPRRKDAKGREGGVGGLNLGRWRVAGYRLRVVGRWVEAGRRRGESSKEEETGQLPARLFLTAKLRVLCRLRSEPPPTGEVRHPLRCQGVVLVQRVCCVVMPTRERCDTIVLGQHEPLSVDFLSLRSILTLPVPRPGRHDVAPSEGRP